VLDAGAGSYPDEEVSMRRATFALGLVAALAFAAPALADSGKLKVNPFVFDPGGTGIIVSGWQAHAGLADAGGSNHGLVLQKNGPTTAFAAAGANVTGAEGQTLSEIGFDVTGHCGAGSPRFDVFDQNGNDHFFGCFYGTHTPIVGAPGWERVRQTGADGFPPMTATDTISSIELIADEGTDQGTGQSVVDNIDVNGTLVGKPGNSK
jgi:hypothetical protein